MAKGYEDFPLPTKDTTINKKWIIYCLIAISIVVLAITVIPLLPKSLDETINILYDEAQNYVDDGNLLQARLIYSEIIELKPNEEKAWHEKGKILVRTNSCNDAVQHYEKYVEEFPESTRGTEGYELAKMCR
ncbi:MAG: tetratricopeptide repeat protein [Nitrosopumilus sp.]|uniref:tetratricopeptide repeat protein n=1 Tax=Nitrosopumilus sp. TaxID=2024843 RepID=UPI00292FB81D|nr:hypothetical protein [Nitrosopumilus sp.]